MPWPSGLRSGVDCGVGYGSGVCGGTEDGQLELFRAVPGELPVRDLQDLMAYPFFSLSKGKRTLPIDFRSGAVTLRVEASAAHGLATIWDADVLIWAASQIVQARDTGLRPSRRIAATPYEILRFIGRGTSLRDYQRLQAALERLQATRVATSIRQCGSRPLQRFAWLDGWQQCTNNRCRPHGIELIVPHWFYTGALDAGLVLTIDADYFRLSGGIERWLYRLVRKHAGWQRDGWHFDFAHLYRKSGSLAPLKDFSCDLRRIVARQPLPGYVLGIARLRLRPEVLTFTAVPSAAPLRLGGSFGAAEVPVDSPVDKL